MWSNGFLLTIELRPGPACWLWPARLAIACGCVVALVMPWPTTELRLGPWVVSGMLLGVWLGRRATRERQILVATTLANGKWRLLVRDGRRLQAELTHYWLTAAGAGLSWRDMRRRRYYLFVARADLAPPTWRRLAVRLRHPPTIA